LNTNKNISHFTDVSPRTAAIFAGLGLLIMATLAPIVQFGILQKLIMSGNAKATVENIMASTTLFRTGIFIFLVVAILDVVVAWALYILLKPVNKRLSLLAAWFRVVYAAIFATALTNLVNVLQFLTGANDLNSIEADQMYTQGMLSLSKFQSGWDIGLVIFGLHLLVVGYLAFKSGYIPKWLGVLLVIAGIGYMVDSFGKFLVPNYNLTIAGFTFIGEVLLIFWLLWKGFKGFDKKLDMKSGSNDKSKETKPDSKIAVGIAIGAGVGAAIGIAIDNIAVGVGIGISIGAALGAAFERQSKRLDDYKNDIV
jgi:F0F1-type ATP synthase membrane subunit c/vacuolar-type H+-ATPase subunit K